MASCSIVASSPKLSQSRLERQINTPSVLQTFRSLVVIASSPPNLRISDLRAPVGPVGSIFFVYSTLFPHCDT